MTPNVRGGDIIHSEDSRQCEIVVGKSPVRPPIIARALPSGRQRLPPPAGQRPLAFPDGSLGNVQGARSARRVKRVGERVGIFAPGSADRRTPSARHDGIVEGIRANARSTSVTRLTRACEPHLHGETA